MVADTHCRTHTTVPRIQVNEIMYILALLASNSIIMRSQKPNPNRATEMCFIFSFEKENSYVHEQTNTYASHRLHWPPSDIELTHTQNSNQDSKQHTHNIHLLNLPTHCRTPYTKCKQTSHYFCYFVVFLFGLFLFLQFSPLFRRTLFLCVSLVL